MPKKKNMDRTYGEKLLTLFAELLFTGDKRSMTGLSKMLDCSKQTVRRLVDDITNSLKVTIREEKQGQRVYFYIPKPTKLPKSLTYTPMELSVLEMCKVFTQNLLGRKQFEEASAALKKSRMLLPEGQVIPSRHFGCFTPGSIDYTQHQDIINILMEAMQKRLVCEISYQRVMADKGKKFYIKPLKIFSNLDTLYLHARRAKAPGKKYREWDYDPLLAVQRIKKWR